MSLGIAEQTKTGQQDITIRDDKTQQVTAEVMTTVPDRAEPPDQTTRLAPGTVLQPTSVVANLKNSPEPEAVATLETTRRIITAGSASGDMTGAVDTFHEEDTTMRLVTSIDPTAITGMSSQEKRSLIPNGGKSASDDLTSLGVSQEAASTARVEPSPGSTSTNSPGRKAVTFKPPLRRKLIENKPVKPGGKF